jgi:uncharacterized membrane protein
MEGLLVMVALAIIATPITLIVRYFVIQNRLDVIETRLQGVERAVQRYIRAIQSQSAAVPPLPDALRADAPPVAPPAPPVQRPAPPPQPATPPVQQPTPPPVATPPVVLPVVEPVAVASSVPQSVASTPLDEPQAPPPPRGQFFPPELPEKYRAPKPSPAPSPAATPRSTEDWEAIIGGNWANKIGVVVTIFGLGYLLQHAFTQMGPGGRVAVSLLVSVAMLIAGTLFEPREKYRIFCYGLIGGGWAGLYTTVYAMYALPAAKVLDSAVLATVLWLSVAAGMIFHSLKYRSQTVTAIAYFLAFTTLAASDVTTVSVIALIPLAASLLFVAWKYRWPLFARYALIATYITCGLHKDTGAPLWETQGLFLIYWLLYEVYDLLHADPWLLPMNAIGFLLLSAGKWSHAAPNDMWQLAAGASALYLCSTLIRARMNRWSPAVLFNAGLATAAIFMKLEHQWIPLALAIEAELYYLAGVWCRTEFLINLGGAIFVLDSVSLAAQLDGTLPMQKWVPVAGLNSVLFYLNRAVRATDVWYGYAAAAFAALIVGYEASDPWRGVGWCLMALAPFAFGWWRRLTDFRIQGYALGLLGAVGITCVMPYQWPQLAIGSAVAYLFALVMVKSPEDRIGEEEREIIRMAASGLTVIGLGTLVWRVVPGEYLGAAWLGLAALLLEGGLLNLPKDFRWLSIAVALLGAGRAVTFDLFNTRVLIAAAISYWFAWRARKEYNGEITLAATWPATLFLLAGLAAALPLHTVAAVWALIALALVELNRPSERLQGAVVAGAVAIRCMTFDMFMSGTGWPTIWPVAATILVLWAAMLRRPVGSLQRTYDWLVGVCLLLTLIFQQSSESALTVAWGAAAVGMVAVGFVLKDRAPRLTGLLLFLVCTAKLFAWDLRNLATVPRILSLIVLGLLMLGVSWVYTRFREQVQKLL